MTDTTYADAVAGADEVLQNVGFEFGRSFVNHAPMAAEALAHLGHGDLVPAWLKENLRTRRYHEVPATRWPLAAADPDSWRPALGDFSRVADWSQMFRRELSVSPWRRVLATWWARLMPGMSGALTHGVIRTAHAARAIAACDDELRRGELASGLAYLAARFSTVPRSAGPVSKDTDRARALGALDELAADSAGRYARTGHRFPIPLIHTITGPAAVRLLCDYLPDGQAWPSYLAARDSVSAIWSYFPPGPEEPVLAPAAGMEVDQVPGTLVAAAIEVGDEHAIKLAEVAVRSQALSSDSRFLSASRAATDLIRRFPV